MVPMRRFIDSHVHMEGFSDPQAIVDACVGVGVDAIVCVGGDIESSRGSLMLASCFPGFFYPAIGVHPSNVLRVDVDVAEKFLRESLGGCVALGEVGLDYGYDFARSRDIRLLMREVFSRFLGVAAEAGKPVSVHSRGAYGDALGLVAGSGVVGAVFHWFDGPLDVLRGVLDAGFLISASPAVTYSKGLRSVLEAAPLERILVETDSPVFLRGLNRRSSPVDVVSVVDALAELKGLDPVEVARVTSRNAEGFFGL